MELHDYMNARGIDESSIDAERERTHERIEAYGLSQICEGEELMRPAGVKPLGASQERAS